MIISQRIGQRGGRMLTLRPGTLQGHACSCSQHLAFFSGASAHRRCMHACKHALLRAAVHARPSSPTDATSSTSALGLLRQNQQPSTGLADRTAVSAELAAASMKRDRPISSAGGRQAGWRRAGGQRQRGYQCQYHTNTARSACHTAETAPVLSCQASPLAVSSTEQKRGSHAGRCVQAVTPSKQIDTLT